MGTEARSQGIHGDTQEQAPLSAVVRQTWTFYTEVQSYLFSSPRQSSHSVCQHLDPSAVLHRERAREHGVGTIWGISTVLQVAIAVLLLEKPLQRHCGQRLIPPAHAAVALPERGSEMHPLTGSQKVAKQNGPTWLLWFEVQLHKPYLEALPLPRAPERTSCSFSTIKKKKESLNHFAFFFSLKQPEHLEFDALWLPVLKTEFSSFLKESCSKSVICFLPGSHLTLAWQCTWRTAPTLGSEGAKHHRLWGR